MRNVNELIGKIGLVPVVAFEDVDSAIPAAKALINGGLPIMEITLRTQAGLPAIKAVKQAYPDMLLGAGTVLSVEQAKAAVDAGAEFIVSPGLNPEVVQWCVDNSVTITPGCVTPTEIEKALSYGLNILKFFPASVYGGVNGCKALYGPYRMVKFVPTGGVSLSNLADFADKPYIHAIGGGWLCKSADVKAGNFDAITKVAKQSIEALLGFEVWHIGINAQTAEDSLAITKMFTEAFGFALKQGNSSNFSGTGVEVNKEMGLGAMGHIAIRTNSIDRAVYYLEQRGYEVDWSTRKGPEDKTIAVYLKSEFGGFAVHLLQK